MISELVEETWIAILSNWRARGCAPNETAEFAKSMAIRRDPALRLPHQAQPDIRLVLVIPHQHLDGPASTLAPTSATAIWTAWTEPGPARSA